jgi:hypothetical protein
MEASLLSGPGIVRTAFPRPDLYSARLDDGDNDTALHRPLAL